MRARVGGVQAGEKDFVWFPGSNKRGSSKYGVILCHGATANEQYADTTRWASVVIPARIAQAGIPCIAGAFGGDTFANDTAIARVTAAKTYLIAQTGCASDKVLLVGASMGGGVAVRWAGQNPTQTAAYVGIMPMSDMSDIYVNNRLGLQATIGTAWGVTYPTALPAAADLSQYATTMKDNGIPAKIYYSSADTAVLPATVTTLATTMGATAIQHDPGALGHSEGGFQQMSTYSSGDWSDLVSFLLAHGA